jgi:hypothetical protein
MLTYSVAEKGGKTTPFPTPATGDMSLDSIASEASESQRRPGSNFAKQIIRRDCYRDQFTKKVAHTVLEEDVKKEGGYEVVLRRTGIDYRDQSLEVVPAYMEVAHVIPFYLSTYNSTVKSLFCSNSSNFLIHNRMTAKEQVYGNQFTKCSRRSGLSSEVPILTTSLMSSHSLASIMLPSAKWTWR